MTLHQKRVISVCCICFIILMDFNTRFILSILIYNLICYIKEQNFFIKFQEMLDKDRKVIINHWLNDVDLVFYSSLINGLKLVGTLLFFISIFEITSFSFYTCNELSSSNFTLAIGLILCSLFAKLVLELNIIFYRNHPVSAKKLLAMEIGFKSAAYSALALAGYCEIASNTPCIRPNNLTEGYALRFHRDYTYGSSVQMVHHEILKTSSSYNLEALIDKDTKEYSSTRERLFIEINKSSLNKELGVFEAKMLGLYGPGWTGTGS